MCSFGFCLSKDVTSCSALPKSPVLDTTPCRLCELWHTPGIWVCTHLFRRPNDSRLVPDSQHSTACPRSNVCALIPCAKRRQLESPMGSYVRKPLILTGRCHLGRLHMGKNTLVGSRRVHGGFPKNDRGSSGTGKPPLLSTYHGPGSDPSA